MVITGNIGGCIAAASATNFLWLPRQGASTAYYTTDAGDIWTAISDLPTNGWGGFAFGPSDKQCAADRVDANTFYLYNNGTSSGVYTSTNGGATWSQTSSGTIAPDGGSPTLKAVPGEAGNLFFSGGIIGSDFLRSTNGGSTWSAVMDGSNNFTNVQAFGFGAAFSGELYPAIYVDGADGSVFGLYRSIDDGTTWTLLANWPNGDFGMYQTSMVTRRRPVRCTGHLIWTRIFLWQHGKHINAARHFLHLLRHTDHHQRHHHLDDRSGIEFRDRMGPPPPTA